jgi:hypothetical protein
MNEGFGAQLRLVVDDARQQRKIGTRADAALSVPFTKWDLTKAGGVHFHHQL